MCRPRVSGPVESKRVGLHDLAALVAYQQPEFEQGRERSRRLGRADLRQQLIRDPFGVFVEVRARRPSSRIAGMYQAL